MMQDSEPGDVYELPALRNKPMDDVHRYLRAVLRNRRESSP